MKIWDKMSRKVGYVYDKRLKFECDRLPAVKNRASIVHDLITSYDLLKDGSVTVVESKPATEEELKYFHATSYLDFLKKVNDSDDLSLYDTEQLEFGLGYDCQLLPRTFDLVRTIAGSSLTAARLLNQGTYDVIINWFGGWHHAQRDEAEGFCYVNDIVIAIQELTKKFSKILYIDLDIHHGNGVQNAFELSRKIVTFSMHKFTCGFYPGTGDVNDVGSLKGKYHSLNVPLAEGCCDKTYVKFFTSIFPRLMSLFQPQAIVVQCGGDCLHGDHVGEFNLTPKSLMRCVQEILNCRLPTLFLGGGGYNFANTARYWTQLTALITEKAVDNDIPDFSQYFTLYKPSYELQIDAGNQKDCNTLEYINKTIEVLLSHCNNIESS